MDPILTRCGYRCDLCLAYRPNIEQHPENAQELSEGWHRYFGFRIPPSEVVCDGCMAEDPHLLDTQCPVRPCVIERGLDNCARCEEYGRQGTACEKLAQRLVTYGGIREEVGEEIPEKDRERFIRPYENKKRLDALKDVT